MLVGESGNVWGFTISDVKNPYSTEISTSMIYTVKTSGGYDVEEEDTDLKVTNTLPGTLAYTTAGAVPDSFTKGEQTSYTVTFAPLNYEQGMKLVITIPEELSLPDDLTTASCVGVGGMDSTSPECVWDAEARTVTLSEAWRLTEDMPEEVQLTLSPLENPNLSLITTSFAL
jgi:hypothetical protein